MIKMERPPGALLAFSALAFSLLWTSASAQASSCPSIEQIRNDLGNSLSPGSTIDNTTANAPRWNEFGAPVPAYVVTVASEGDVAATVKYANNHSLPFLAQSQGNGWADTFNLGSCGIIINLINLNGIAFNADETLVTIQGGTLNDDLIKTAYANDTRVANPTCPCLGFLGASLGGGLTRAMGLYGYGVDQIVSVNLVLPSGESVFVDATHNQDLWFAVRGAVSNFGIVTSAVVKAYPQAPNENTAWQGLLQFSDEQLGPVIDAIYNLDLSSGDMEIDLLMGTSGAPNYTPGITVVPIYFGSEADATKAFSSILSLGPVSNPATELPYINWGDWAINFCTKGLRKPTYGTTTSRQSLSNAQPWIELYNEFKNFIKTYPEAANSSVLAEYYPVQKAVQIATENAPASYAWRSIPLNTVVIPLYANASLDGPANAFGRKARDILWTSDPQGQNSTYINFAHGDETNQQIYGANLPRLQQLKAKYDPQNRFNQWFPIALPTS